MNLTPFLSYYSDMGGGSALETLLMALAIGAVVALIAVLIMRGQMNSARFQQDAAGYMKQDSFHLTIKEDTFLYSRVSKTPRPRDTGGQGSGHSGGRPGGPRGRF